MAKAWLRERWTTFFQVLEGLTVEQEEEIKRLCEIEKESIRNRPTMKSLSSLKEPMSDTRNALIAFFKDKLTPENSWENKKLKRREHLSLKYMNWSEDEWSSMDQESEKRHQERLQFGVQLLDNPAEIVATAQQLLSSAAWSDIAVGLAVLTGRRLSEVLKTGKFSKKTLYTVMFSGQLKRGDVFLKPYEIPVLLPADEIIAATMRLRSLRDCSKMDVELISKTYGSEVADAADRHFERVPLPLGKTRRYTHLFRAVYPRIAVHWFCPVTATDTNYVPSILGHYWETGTDETQKLNYMSSLHYNDYRIGNGDGNIDGRQGIRLSEPGVEIIEAFKPRSGSAAEEKKPMARTKKAEKVVTETEGGLVVEKTTQTGYSSLRPRITTKARFDQVIVEEHIQDSSPADACLSLLLDEHYELKQIKQYGEALEGLAAVLAEAAAGKQEDETVVAFLSRALEERRNFKQSYANRGADRDYSKVETSKLLDIKKPEAARERFKRGVDAIIAYNDACELAEMRWHINPKSLTDLVGGKPAIASEYLVTRPDVQAHHDKYGLKAAYNRRSVKIKERVMVPELPEVATPELHHDEIPVES